MSRHLKLIAAVAVVLVALSGFSPARSSGGGKGGGSRSSSGGKGGGCSSSSSSSHNSSSTYDDDDSDYDSGYSSTGTSGSRYNSSTGTSGSRYNSSRRDKAPSATITQCAADSGTAAKAVVSVRNPNRSSETYEIKVQFDDSVAEFVDSGTTEVTVEANQEKPVDVRMDHPERIDGVSACKVVSVR
ncbi:hypothetical protein ACFPA8_09880 [Streptomyces ovatisporus]|uniref:Secreted protein n=1 Tax=Streptomyces ovatisporus TaxID=1128682 RepID=A0ABV9A3Y4_9ACTN